jgi:arsenate reductase (thioredoxin)
MNQIKILFLCIHNSARSQMAEAYMKKYGGEKFLVESAGLEAGKLNPLAVEVMREDGIDISKNETKDAFEFFKQGRTYQYVVTVCDEANAARCPNFPGVHKKISWSFMDPSALTGSHDEKLAATRQVRNKIKDAVLSLVDELNKL